MKHALIERFLALVAIDSPSGEEENLRSLIKELCAKENLPYTLDEMGNLFVPVNCTERPPLTFAAHLDTAAMPDPDTSNSSSAGTNWQPVFSWATPARDRNCPKPSMPGCPLRNRS